jgi:hypothetical protein
MKLEIFAFCESAYVSARKMTVCKIHDIIIGDSAPMKIPQCAVVYRIRFEGGELVKHQIRMEIRYQDGSLLGRPYSSEITPERRTDYNTFSGIVVLNGMILPAFGEYTVNFYADDTQLGFLSLHCQQT